MSLRIGYHLCDLNKFKDEKIKIRSRIIDELCVLHFVIEGAKEYKNEKFIEFVWFKYFFPYPISTILSNIYIPIYVFIILPLIIVSKILSILLFPLTILLIQVLPSNIVRRFFVTNLALQYDEWSLKWSVHYGSLESFEENIVNGKVNYSSLKRKAFWKSYFSSKYYENARQKQIEHDRQKKVRYSEYVLQNPYKNVPSFIEACNGSNNCENITDDDYQYNILQDIPYNLFLDTRSHNFIKFCKILMNDNVEEIRTGSLSIERFGINIEDYNDAGVWALTVEECTRLLNSFPDSNVVDNLDEDYSEFLIDLKSKFELAVNAKRELIIHFM
jgi:hypothetical protein